MSKNTFRNFWIILWLMGLNSYVFSQDIEPRRWTPLPLGTHVIGAGYAFADSDVYFDPVLQTEDVKQNMDIIAVSYVQPFKIGNKLARVDVTIPYVFGKWDGKISGEPKTLNRQGFADPRIRVSLNLIGPNAMNRVEMMEYIKANPVNTMLGVSLAVNFPLGQYAEDRLINLGNNRFIIRPQIGMVHNWGAWSYELTTSVFIFTTNNQFFNHQEKKQNPLYAVQSHLIHRFKNRMWVSASAGLGSGGSAIIDGVSQNDARGDFLGAISFGAPITKTQAVKLSYLRSVTFQDIGSDSNTLGFGWSMAF